MALSIMEETPVAELPENERSLAVDFVNPRHATPAEELAPAEADVLRRVVRESGRNSGEAE